MPKRPLLNQTCSISLRLAAAALLVITAAQHSLARSDRRATSIEILASRTVGEPVMAIVSLRSQSINACDSQGWIARSPVSSGQTDTSGRMGHDCITSSLELQRALAVELN
jgi:hypothetical protein